MNREEINSDMQNIIVESTIKDIEAVLKGLPIIGSGDEYIKAGMALMRTQWKELEKVSRQTKANADLWEEDALDVAEKSAVRSLHHICIGAAMAYGGLSMRRAARGVLALSPEEITKRISELELKR